MYNHHRGVCPKAAGTSPVAPAIVKAGSESSPIPRPCILFVDALPLAPNSPLFGTRCPVSPQVKHFNLLPGLLAIWLRGYPALASLSRRAPDLSRRFEHRRVEHQARRGGARGESVRFFPSRRGQSFRVTSAGLRYTASHRVDHIVLAPDRSGLLLAAVSTAASTTWADTSAASNLAARCLSARKGATLNSARHFWM